MSSPAKAKPRAYRDPNVLRWLGAYTGSVTGDVVYSLALTWTATQVAGPAKAGLVVGAGAVPRAVLMLAGGVVADRFGPRRIAIVSDATRCLVILAAALLILLTRPGLPTLLAVALIFGAVDALFMPAVGALPATITVPSQLVRVQGMRGLSIRLSNTLGPVLGGAVLAAAGAVGAFGTAGVLFAISLVLLLTVRTTASAPIGSTDGAWRGLTDGLRYLRRHRVLAPLVVVIGLSEMCFSGPVAVGLVMLARERGWGAAGMGWIAGAFSVGGAASTLLITAVRRIPRAGVIAGCSLLATAAATVILGAVPNLGTAIALGGMVGLTSGTASVLTQSLLQTAADPGYLGRVTSVTTLCTLGLAPILMPAVGLTVAAWGAAAFFLGCGGICLIAAALAFLVRSLRQAELRSPDDAAVVINEAGDRVTND